MYNHVGVVQFLVDHVSKLAIYRPLRVVMETIKDGVLPYNS